MLVIKTKKGSKFSFKVGKKIFKENSAKFKHLDNMVSGEKPEKKNFIMKNGVVVGSHYHYNVKGVLPVTGFTVRDNVSRKLKSKLYGLFK